MQIQDPGEIYRGSRFDWTGQVVQVVYKKKHTFCTAEEESPSSLAVLGQGIYNEFGIDQPVGYEECEPSGLFHKIGVGLLQKQGNSPYHFQYPYRIIPGEIKLEESAQGISWKLEGRPVNGYAYSFRKRIQLEPSGFTIAYSLQNTGSKGIETSEYVHNFLSINKRRPGPGYRLIFSFDLQHGLFGETVNPGEVVNLGKNEVGWKSVPEAAFFFSEIGPPGLHNASWELQHMDEHTGIRETVDFPVLRVNLWGCGHVVSPEVFYAISLLPGESCRWKRTYELLDLS